jgi:nucleoside phosphorylase
MSAGRGTGLTAIVAPLGAELAGVLAATAGLRRHAAPRRFSGRLGGVAVVIAATGDGAAAAAAGVEALLAAVRPQRLLAIGVAGGLTPGLAEGALIAANLVCDEAGVAAPRPPDARWLADAVACGATAGLAVSTRRILADPRAKQAAWRGVLPGVAAVAGAAWPGVDRATAATSIWAAAGADGGAAAGVAAGVDLESMAYAAAAAAHGVPYLVVRAVLDPAEETLPLDFEHCRGAGGRVSHGRVVLRALERPGSFAELWRLRARVRTAAARLGDLAERLMLAAEQTATAAAADAASHEASYDPDRRRQEPPEALAAGMSAWELHSRANTTAAAGGRRA